jgi:hypothetical protein
MAGFFEHGCAGVSFPLRFEQPGMAHWSRFFFFIWLQLSMEWRTMKVSSFLSFLAAVQD